MVAFIPLLAGGVAFLLLTYKNYKSGRKKK